MHMAGTSLKTIITPPLNHHHHHHDRRHSALLAGAGTAATCPCQFGSIRLRKLQVHHLRRLSLTTVRASNAAVGYATTRSSFYDLLQVSKEVSCEEIKKAYRRLALRYHPDVSPPDLVEENARRFMDVQEAYQTLSDPSRRKVYDSSLRLAVGSATTSAKWPFNDQELYERSSWKREWEDQLEKLKRRSMTRYYSYSDLNSNLSWGARMRQRWAESTVL